MNPESLIRLVAFFKLTALVSTSSSRSSLPYFLRRSSFQSPRRRLLSFLHSNSTCRIVCGPTSDERGRNPALQVLHSVCALTFEVTFALGSDYSSRSEFHAIGGRSQSTSESLVVYSLSIPPAKSRCTAPLWPAPRPASGPRLSEVVVFSQLLVYRHAHTVLSGHADSLI
jgi:hypothetical protein